MLESIFNEIEISKVVLIKIDKSHFNDDLDPIILSNNIQNQLFPNILQCIIIEKVLSHVISNKKCQYQD